MRLRRHFFSVLTLGALLLGLLVLFSKGLFNRDLNVGMHPWPGYETLLLAKHFAWLTDNISVIESENASQTIELLKAGDVQVAALTLDEAISVAADGLDISIVAILNESVGADVVLARPNLHDLSDLKGKTIALEGSSVSYIVLDQLLHKAGLRNNDVSLVYLPPNEQLLKWERSDFDVAISFEPYATYIENKGAQRILDSQQFPDLIFDVLVVRNDLMWLRNGHLTQLLEGHFRANQYIRINREDALRRIAAWRKLSYDEVEVVFGGLYLPDLNYNKSMLGPHSDFLKAMQNDVIFQTSSKDVITDAMLLKMLNSAYLDRLQ